MTGDRRLTPLQVWRSDPLVIGAPIADEDDAERVAAALAAGFPANSFIAVVAAREAAVLERILTSSLRAHLAEMVFTTPASGPEMDSSSAALPALEQFGVGQDYVFSVDVLDEALRYALRVLQRDRDRWVGDAIVVLPAAGDIDEARAVLDGPTG
jgi:uncharacterized protein with PIN domain